MKTAQRNSAKLTHPIHGEFALFATTLTIPATARTAISHSRRVFAGMCGGSHTTEAYVARPRSPARCRVLGSARSNHYGHSLRSCIALADRTRSTKHRHVRPSKHMAIVIDRRFRGPNDSGNGGYSAGLFALAHGGDVVEVTLRLPPPLETPLELDGERILAGDELVADVR